MSREEWLSWRRSGIGSSDAPAIMKVSPWKNLLDVWEDKVYGEKDNDSDFKRRGREMEETARREFEKKFDTILYNLNVEHIKTPWLHASLDGIDLEGGIMVEIKCPGQRDHSIALNKEIPDKYYPQLQHQLMVTGLDGMYYFSFDGKEGATIEVARDQKYIDEMFEEEKKFWNLVETNTPPYVCMKANKTWNYLTDEVEVIRERIKDLESEEDRLIHTLKEMSKGRSAKGIRAFFQRQDCKGAINYDQAIKDYIDNMRSIHPSIEFPDCPTEAYRKNSFQKWTLKFID
jgi:putative phage-type endonuclease